jgi:phospholipase A2
MLWPKLLFGQPIRLVDLYGIFLSKILLEDRVFEQKQYLSDLMSRIYEGAIPFPVFPAISMHKMHDKLYEYNWYGFSPLEVRNYSNNLSIPLWSFGRKFSQGISTNYAPEQHLGYLLGIFGSAYAINLKDLNTIFLQYIEQEENQRSTPLEKFKYGIIAKAIKLLGNIANARLSPAQVHNPFFKLPASFGVQQWLTKKHYLTFVDAGIDFNLPLPLVWHKARAVDLIIIGDSSAEATPGTELAKAFRYAKKLGYTYTRIDQNQNPTLRIYKDLTTKEAPVIVYINFKHELASQGQATQDLYLKVLVEQNSLKQFNSNCLNLFCHTLNFSYTEEQFKQLSGIGAFNIVANKETLKKIIEDILITKAGLHHQRKPVNG